MRVRITLIASVMTLCATPVLAQDLQREEALEFHAEYAAKPKTLRAFSLAERSFEMRAVTRRAQADTAIRREHLEESIEMAGVYPGYPQPAFVTIDLSVKF